MARIKVLVSEEPDDRVGLEELRIIPGVEIITYDPNEARPSDLQRAAEVLIPPYRSSHRPIQLLAQLPKLRMVQLLTAGVDEWLEHVPVHVALASARGAHAGPVSEWVLSAILAQLRQWPTLVRFQDSETWAHRRFDAETLAGKRALIIGAGSIGMSVARRLAAFDATSTLVASSARAGIHGSAELPNLIGGHSVVVITAPLNRDTYRLVDGNFLAAMDDGALLINAARGQIVDTDALVAELTSGRLRAALDVTDPEPLPPGHPLWARPGVIISPHSARTVPGTNRLCYEVAAKQIRSFADGHVPDNAVRKDAS
ncbi:phosphoglycerate dehydrogenase-like enzyme [Saccharothrix tamanrassetensis]|uniref:Phosphoglycerate dehydrogenase-like enzyme n=1 Tax=Saccharothrix tamanrassetensis TaxID=1051531 RepID=A0A841CQV2_9PSEU|nr:NAD(P)-dependent oxidoreductase [Saccharothrix tamanrassetensis]MBB5958427.1 phosphoglycerate dehydrogenase-like enzyme [Saccharothrix tamanrassetensis]